MITNFCDFRKKIGVFLEIQCYDQNFAEFSFVLSKKRQFFWRKYLNNHNIGRSKVLLWRDSNPGLLFLKSRPQTLVKAVAHFPIIKSCCFFTKVEFGNPYRTDPVALKLKSLNGRMQKSQHSAKTKEKYFFFS
jgi:hypothetical protein